MSDSRKQWILLISVVTFVILIDQIAEWLTITNLALGQTWEPFSVLGGFIKVMRSHNTGAAFGMFPSGSTIFLVLAIVTTLLFVVMYPQMPDGAWLSRFGMALIIGGALSNAIDRVQFGYVVDYFYIRLWGNYSNISNFADHAITLGVILLLFDQWKLEQRAKHSTEPSTAVEQDSAFEPADVPSGSPETALPSTPPDSHASPEDATTNSDLPSTAAGDLSANPPVG